MSQSPPASEIEAAIEHHKNGRLEQAREIYARILAADPDAPEALTYLGVMHVQHGDPNVGASLLKRAVTVAPGYADAHTNLGNALVELGHADDARTCYENALVCNQAHAEAYNNLGVVLRHAGDLHGALAHALCAVQLRPDWAVAHLNLGNAYAHLRHSDKAVEAYGQAVRADPHLTDAYRMLGYAFYAKGDLERAAAVFRQLLDIDPDNPVASHMLAAVSGADVPARCSQGYVSTLFDQFASSFDEQLARLDYAGPGLIGEALERHLPEPAGSLRCLDMGAGTGLCAPIVSPWTRELVGVDLSREMLAKAARRGGYDELAVADLCDYLRGDVGRFDLIVSADVLIYFGVLEEIVGLAARRLAPGGWLVFTLEALAEDETGEHRLRPHGRYAHARAYVESCIREAGLEPVVVESRVIRREMGQDVAGWLVSAARPEDPAETGVDGTD